MRPNIPQKIAEGAAAPVTLPIVIIQIGTLRLSSRGDVTYDGHAFVGAQLRYTGTEISIYNEAGQFTEYLYSNNLFGYVGITVWISYGADPFVDDDWIMEFSGRPGAVQIADWVTIQLRPSSTRLEPHYRVGRPWANHLLRKGTVLLTPAGPKPVPNPPAPVPVGTYNTPTIPPWAQLPVVPAATLNKQNPLSVTLANSAAEGQVIPVIYGPFQIGGKPLTAHYDSGSETWTVSYLVGLGEIQEITTVLLNGAAPVSGVEVNTYTGTTSQDVDPLMGTALGVAYEDRNIMDIGTGVLAGTGVNLLGIAYVVVQWTNTHYPSPPEVVIEGFGRVHSSGVLIGLPITTPALYMRDFIQNIAGQQVDVASFQAVSATNIAYPANLPEPRRDGGMILDTAQSLEDWIEIFSEYAGCFAFKRGSQWVVTPDAVQTPVKTLTAADFVKGTFRVFIADPTQVPNVINLIYTDTSTTIWQEDTVTAPAALPDNPRESTIRMPGIQSQLQANWDVNERLAKIVGLSFTGVVADNNMTLELGDVIATDHYRLPSGTAYEFRITDIKRVGTARKPRAQISGTQYIESAYTVQDYAAQEPSAGGSGVIGES